MREGLQAPLQSYLGGVGGYEPKSLLFNLDGNKISDMGCWHICEVGCLRVNISFYLNTSDHCDIREEGCRSIAKRQGFLERLYCKFAGIKVDTTKLVWRDQGS